MKHNKLFFLMLILSANLTVFSAKVDNPDVFGSVGSMSGGLDIRQQHQTTFTNPVILGDVADPTVIKVDGVYYACGTSSEWAPYYPMYSSTDLINWKQEGHVFNKKPSWTSNSFWAPELYYHNNKVFCYYTARNKKNGISGIGVASTDDPTKEFTDHGLLIEHGKEAIDAYVFNDDGQLYISWKAYGLESRPIELVASKLSYDGLRLEGEPFSLLKDDEEIGMEGQSHFKHGDYYYIVYAARGCCGFNSDYEVRVARSKSFKGPYEKYEHNPILAGLKHDFISIGHGTIVETDDNRMFYMCHAYLNGEGKYAGRQPVIYEMYVDDNDWMAFKGGQIARKTQTLPFEGSYQQSSQAFEDDFTSTTLNVNWTWNYPYSDIQTTIRNGNLYLTGKPVGKKAVNGNALCVRPQFPDYEYQTQVVNRNKSLKGLTLYGDYENFVAWGVEDNQFVLKQYDNNKEVVLFSKPIESQYSYVKILVKEGRKLDFYYANKEEEWNKALDSSIDMEKLVRWDRIARPGLIHIGETKEHAAFSYFKLTKL